MVGKCRCSATARCDERGMGPWTSGVWVWAGVGSAPGRRFLCFRRSHPFAKPIGDLACNLHTVLLQHQIVGVAVYADIGQPNEVVVDARLLQEQRVAVIRRGVETCFRGQDQNRDA